MLFVPRSPTLLSDPVRRSTLADANEARDWRIYSELAQRLITQARRLYADEDLGLDLKNSVYALDSTTIDLCLSVFPWAHFRSTKAAVKAEISAVSSVPSPVPVSAVTTYVSALPATVSIDGAMRPLFTSEKSLASRPVTGRLNSTLHVAVVASLSTGTCWMRPGSALPPCCAGSPR